MKYFKTFLYYFSAVVLGLAVSLANADVRLVSMNLANGTFLKGVTSSGALQTLIGVPAATTITRVLSSGDMEFYQNGSRRWYLTSGYLTQDSSGGGDIVLSKANTFLALTAQQSIAAAGSTISDCTGLSKSTNNVTTVTAGQGVCLPSVNNTGTTIMVRNQGANDLKLYPNSSSANINNGGAGAAITLTTAAKQLAICTYITTNAWICGVMTAT